MRALAFTRTTLVRFARDRTAMFFLVLLPILVIVLVGITVSGDDKVRIGIVDEGQGPLAAALVADLEQAPAVSAQRFDDVGTASDAVRRGELTAAVVVPAAFDDTVRAGGTSAVTLVTAAASTALPTARAVVDAAVARESARIGAAQLAVAQAGGSFDERLATATALQSSLPRVSVTEALVDSQRTVLPGGFEYSAPTMLVLFVFINTLAGGAAIIHARRLGIYDRACASSISVGTIIAGETLTYVAIALGQSALIVFLGAFIFGVHWGDPLAATALVVLWALVGASVGMLAGTVFRTPEQASAVGPALGMALGMLGGCMWPLEIVGDTMRRVGHLVPQAWAVDAWVALVARDGGLADISRQLLVLAAFATVLLALATTRLRHVLQS